MKSTQAADVYQQMNMMVTGHWVPQATGVAGCPGPSGSCQAKLLKLIGL